MLRNFIQILFSFLFLVTQSLVWSQDGFRLPEKQKKDKISIQVINNLPIIPVEINGAKLSFILDTGVKSTILFSLSRTDSLQINNTTPIELQGLGSGGTVEAIKSENNVIKVGSAVDVNHRLYVIFDQNINFSPRMGIPIHGILGSDFFQNFVVKINYSTKNITLYNPKLKSPKICRKCEEATLRFFDGKPFLEVEVNTAGKNLKQLLLVDSGSSDALWLFEDNDWLTQKPKNYFEDFLGLGLSGGIYGKRSRLDEVQLGHFKMKKVNVAFPDAEAINFAKANKERDGSLGGSFLKRFTEFFDYKNKKAWFKKNRDFNDSFYYNMSGLTIEHDGMDVVRELKQSSNFSRRSRSNEIANSDSGVSVSNYNYYSIKLVPKFVVAEIRENSAAQMAGIVVGDEIISINGKSAHNYTLNQLIEIFTTEEGKRITLDVLRNNIAFKIRFYLKRVLN